MKGLRVITIVKGTKFEGVWDKLELKTSFHNNSQNVLDYIKCKYFRTE